MQLSRSLGAAGTLDWRERGVAAGTTDACFVMGGSDVGGGDRVATAPAELMGTWFESVSDGDALVEDKAFAFPLALSGGDFL